MNKKIVLLGAIGLVSFGMGIWAGSSSRSVETREVEKIVYRDRIVESRDRNIESRTVRTEMPDGTKVTETVRVISDRSRTESETQVDSVRVVELKTSQPDWGVGLYASVLPRGEVPTLTMTVDRRILGNLSVGLYGRYNPLDGDMEAGAGLRVEF